mgnify:CR=1 FL=1
MNKEDKNTHILVTGGAGFIGTHLVNELVRRHKNITIDVVDNLSNSFIDDDRKFFFKKHNISFYESSVSGFAFPEGRKYSQIYHLASPVGPAGVLNYAGSMGVMIINDALKMARRAIEDGAKLLCVSTSEVYGSHPEGDKPQQEDIPKIVPARITVRLEYGVGKLLMEIALLNLAKVEPLYVNFIRPFNIIGPLQKGKVGFVVPRFVDAVLKGEPLTIFGDGSQKRTFTHVVDIVEAFLMLMAGNHKGKIYNVGNPKNLYSIKELAERIVQLSGSSSEIHRIDPKTLYGPLYEEAWNKIPNIGRISEDLGWQPKYSLDEILEECIDFARGNRNYLNPF